jgi:dTDP-glucose pyrophosphorylase
MNVLMLMAGSSGAYREAGFPFPKPLVEICDQPILQHVLRSLEPLTAAPHRAILALRSDENAKYHVGAVARLLDPRVQIVEVRADTGGAACTALLAVDMINNTSPLVVVNGDQIIDTNLDEVIQGFQQRELDGGIVVFEDVHPRWSFVKCDAQQMVIEAAEKRPISNNATAGFYYFARGTDFVAAVKSMILKDAQVNGSFYVCPAYNELILLGRGIGVHRILKEQYFSLSTPQGAQNYAAHLQRISVI